MVLPSPFLRKKKKKASFVLKKGTQQPAVLTALFLTKKREKKATFPFRRRKGKKKAANGIPSLSSSLARKKDVRVDRQHQGRGKEAWRRTESPLKHRLEKKRHIDWPGRSREGENRRLGVQEFLPARNEGKKKNGRTVSFPFPEEGKGKKPSSGSVLGEVGGKRKTHRLRYSSARERRKGSVYSSAVEEGRRIRKAAFASSCFPRVLRGKEERKRGSCSPLLAEKERRGPASVSSRCWREGGRKRPGCLWRRKNKCCLSNGRKERAVASCSCWTGEGTSYLPKQSGPVFINQGAGDPGAWLSGKEKRDHYQRPRKSRKGFPRPSRRAREKEEKGTF